MPVGVEKLEDIEDVYNAALPFLASEYERFMRKTCEYLLIDLINQVHFILAGHSEKNPNNFFQMYLLWTKKKLPFLDGDELSAVYSVTRLIAIEYQLSQLCKKNTNLADMGLLIRAHFEKQSIHNPEISGVFSIAGINRDGFYEAL